MTVLIIEDEEFIRDTLRDILELNGYTILAAANGREGLQLAARRPDVILCDINMPELNGYGVLTELQRQPELRAIPLIFLTAVADRASQRQGMELGAADYITKPFSEGEVLKAIEAALRRLQPLRERIDLLVTERKLEADANWSHELLTPLNGLFGALELIEAEIDDIKPDELRELLGFIRESAQRQQELSRKLILFFELERRRAAPGARAERCQADTALAAGARQAAGDEKRANDLVVQGAPGTVPLHEAHLQAAVAELVHNACRFSKPGQKVTVTGAAQAGRYRIEVTDEGVGMTDEQRANTAPFRQFARRQQNQQGLGLGLAIARAVAEISGGRMELAPGPTGRGLRVTLELPGV